MTTKHTDQKQNPSHFIPGKSESYGGGKIRQTYGGKWCGEVNTDGNRKRKFFDKKKDVQKWIQSEIAWRENRGRDITKEITAKEIEDALDAYAKLRAAGRSESLREVVDNFLNREQGAGSDFILIDLFQEHINDLKARRRERTWIGKQNRLLSFIELYGSLKLSEVTFDEVSTWLESTGHTGRTLRNDQIDIQSFFNWIDQHTKRKAREAGTPEMHWHNDVAIFPASDWETSDAPEIGTVSNADAVAVLRRLEELDPESALVLALGLLAGLRTAEIVEKDGLLWENIDLTEREITITAKQSKTKHGRTVHINDALLAWLLKYKQESGRVGRRFNAFRKYRSQACQGVGITWPHNAARHTFASNYCKVNGERAAADALGHVGTVKMLLDHYRGVMQSKAKAEAYFKILKPVGAGRDVIQMKTA
jgi:hypothetical protein